MANCSFIQATEARNIARNNTLIWEEICGIQTQILAGIDGNVYSVIVNDATPFTATQSILSVDVTSGGAGYTTTSTTATIADGGTGGSGALVTPVVTGSTITSFTIDNGGDLVLQSAAPVVAGTGYSIGEVLTLDGTGATVTTAATVSVTSLSTIAGQTEADYAASFTAGAGYTALDVITLDDGTKVRVDTAPGGNITEFTILTSTTVGITGDLATLSQLGAALPAGGTGFTLTQQLANQSVLTVTVANPGLYTVVPTSNPDTTTTAGAGDDTVTLSWVITAGYTPVSVTATIDLAKDLIDGQDETNFNNTLPNGTFNAGTNYRVGEIISLVDASTVTIDNISATGVVSTQGQTQAVWTLLSGGDGVGGTAYVVNDIITLTDGSTITVNSIDGNGDVVTFTVTTASILPYASGATLQQSGAVSGTGNGLGFTLQSAVGNEITVGSVTEFTTASPGATAYYQTTLLQLSTDGIGSGFTLTPAGNNQISVVQGTGATLVVTESGGAVVNVAAVGGGSGYLVGATLTFNHPSGFNAAATVTSVAAGGVIDGITISNGGQDYEQAVATVTVVAPNSLTPAIAFVGTVVTTNGSVTGISIQEGGLGYADLYPTVTVSDSTGAGATFTTNVAGGLLTAVNVVTGGAGYSQTPTPTILNSDGTVNNTAVLAFTVGTSTWNTVPTAYHDELIGLSSDPVIADQIQYVLDYFTSLGYNIRAQTNSTTTNTMQWQIIW